MINVAQAAMGRESGIMAGISNQGRSGFAADPLIPPPVPIGNLAGPSGPVGVDPIGGEPVPMPDIQNAGGDGLAPVDGGVNPIADATANEPYQIPQGRSFI